MLTPGLSYAPADVLPHGGAMLLLDEICGYGDDWVEAAVEVRADSAFAGADGVPAWVGVEYMAQAVCAWSGIEQRQRGEAPAIGLLLGTRRYETSAPAFAPGSRLRVRAHLAWRDEADLGAFECTISQEGRTLATAQLKVYRPPDVVAFLKNSA